jgi:predicted lysophospholipase L1 biosynthesis ABC-type transport system permease subunit
MLIREKKREVALDESARGLLAGDFSFNFSQRLSKETKSRVTDLCKQFPSVLKRVQFFKENKFPERSWPQLW